MQAFSETSLLTRIDPRRNMARYYCLSVEPTLFGGFVLHRTWGRLGTYGRSRLDFYADLSAACSRKRQLEAEKLRRGYCIR